MYVTQELSVFALLYTWHQDDSDEEDFEIKATDNLLVVAKAEADYCSMEIHGNAPQFLYTPPLDVLLFVHVLTKRNYMFAIYSNIKDQDWQTGKVYYWVSFREKHKVTFFYK